MESNTCSCEKCNDTGWVLASTIKDNIHPGYEVFKAMLYIECTCKEEKAA